MYDKIIHKEVRTMARKPVTVSLPEKLVKATSRFCREHSVTVSEMTREALSEYLYKQELEQARRNFTVHVEKLGISSEQDLLRRIAG